MEENFYNQALRFLSYRPRSEKEVVNKLKIKYQKSNIKDLDLIIAKVIEKLKDYKFIDDVEFARKWIEDRIRFKPRSMRLIKLELKRKGIAEEIINEIINDKGRIINDLESARKLVEKRIERLKGLNKQEVYEKLGRFLAAKGFNWDTIKKAIDPVKS